MDGFTYNNIFDTKGIEYIAIIIFFLLLIPFWIYLNRRVSLRQAVGEGVSSLSLGRISIPKGIFFNQNHTWAFLEKSGEARIGLDDFLLHVMGSVSVDPLLLPGTPVTKGQPVAKIRQDGRELLVSSPVSGILLSSNTSVLENPELMQQDPYGKGWICAIQPEKWLEETRSFYVAEKAAQWVSGELSRFRDFIAFSLRDRMNEFPSVVLQDGGEICEHALASLPDEVWIDFQKEFLNDIRQN